MTHGLKYRVVAGLLMLGGWAAAPLAGQGIGVVAVNPSWLKSDDATRTTEFTLIAGLTTANAGMNFNGSTTGALKLSVPVGWTVVLHFRNADPNLPHSAAVIRAVAPLPPGVAPLAFAHAATGQLAQGMPNGGHQDVRFVAQKAGAYFIYCPVQSHGMLGMWLRFDVSAALARPTVTTAKQGAP